MKAFYEVLSAPEMTWLVLKAPHMPAEDAIGMKFHGATAVFVKAYRGGRGPIGIPGPPLPEAQGFRQITVRRKSPWRSGWR